MAPSEIIALLLTVNIRVSIENPPFPPDQHCYTRHCYFVEHFYFYLKTAAHSGMLKNC